MTHGTATSNASTFYITDAIEGEVNFGILFSEMGGEVAHLVRYRICEYITLH